jgi:UDP-hydrolysing UDP-N-acetyl-D-glucosamine 2-epimerase
LLPDRLISEGHAGPAGHRFQADADVESRVVLRHEDQRYVKRIIAALTTSRSDYAHLQWLLHDLARHPAVDLRLIALGPHLSPEFGHTGRQIAWPRPRNVVTLECLLSSDTDVGMAKTLGLATLGLADVLGRMRPDLLLLIADRYEMLAPAAVALTLRIPMAHIEGGETTAGAIDDAVRNAITKMAHLHFTSTRAARKRVIALGEQPWRVRWSGSLSLDHLRRARWLSRSAVEKRLGVSLRPKTVVAIHHPVTLMKDTVEEAREVFAALGRIKEQVLLVYPNADAGARSLIEMAESFVRQRPGVRLFVNFDHLTYLSLLRYSSVLVGNSSSGMIESTSLGIPTLNIGIRQRGREHAANVLDVPARQNAILAGIAKALTPSFRKKSQGLANPYGDGHASRRIAQTLVETPLGNKLLFKNFPPV